MNPEQTTNRYSKESHQNESVVQFQPMFQVEKAIITRSVWGPYAKLRLLMVFITQAWFYGLPWLSFNHRQAVLFDIAQRRFYLGPWVFYPQDFIFLTGLLIVCALSLFLFTAIAGRVWCGYACPQTVYTQIFMAIERFFEGDRNQKLRLLQTPRSPERIIKTTAKHIAWLTLGLWTGFTFVGYFTPIKPLFENSTHLSLAGWSLFWVLFYGFATYGNAGFMREQVCKYMCPYARFQSAMFDHDTLLITYDAKRGEPRGPRSKNIDPQLQGMGSCIDCGLCVQVCPTGIDIRNGLQYECIGCAACVDVCNEVMRKMNYPTGLVRYSTHQAITQALCTSNVIKRMFRPRMLAYGSLLLGLAGVVIWGVISRPAVRFDVIRDRTIHHRIVDDTQIENVYKINLMNTTEHSLNIQLQVFSTELPSDAPRQHRNASITGISKENPNPRFYVSDPVTPITLQPAQNLWLVRRVQTPITSINPGSHQILFQVTGQTLTANNDATLAIQNPHRAKIEQQWSQTEVAAFLVPADID